jgi:hypothetical protein
MANVGMTPRDFSINELECNMYARYLKKKTIALITARAGDVRRIMPGELLHARRTT